MKRVLALPAFRLLAVGTGTSLLGDQFALVAMPWLALRLTGDPLALGIVLALEGVPRAAFMLIGGAITDRFSPRAIMIASDVVRFALTGLLAAIVFAGAAQTWMLYAFALAFGLVAGFAVPAANSIVPTLVEERDLQAGNSVVMGLGQLVGFLGPTLAGIVIGAYARSFAGIGLAFAIDAVSFAVSATCLALIGSAARSLEDGAEEAQGMWASILSGVRYLWSDRPLRLVVLLLAAVNLLLIGPLLVGIPVLADQRLPQGALAFGLLMSAYSGGNLVGFVLAGSLPRIGGAAMRVLLIGLLAAFGLVVGALGFLGSTWIDFGLLLVLGVGNGYAAILLFTWVQARTPKAMLGRMMSILMLTNTGLVPVSQALSGAVAKWDLTALFAGAGALELLVAVGAAFRPEIRTFSESLVGGSVREGAPDAGPRGESAPADQAPADQARGGPDRGGPDRGGPDRGGPDRGARRNARHRNALAAAPAGHAIFSRLFLARLFLVCPLASCPNPRTAVRPLRSGRGLRTTSSLARPPAPAARSRTGVRGRGRPLAARPSSPGTRAAAHSPRRGGPARRPTARCPDWRGCPRAGPSTWRR